MASVSGTVLSEAFIFLWSEQKILMCGQLLSLNRRVFSEEMVLSFLNERVPSLTSSVDSG